MARTTKFGGDVITIRKMLVQQTGEFKQVYNRGWELDLDENAFNSIRNRLHGAGPTSQLSGSMLKGMGRLLTPSMELDTRRDAIHIPDGWDRPRCRFMMEVEVDNRFGSLDTYYLQGFSDHLGLTSSGKIDTHMRWFVNGFIRVQFFERETRRGVERYGVVKNSAQVINGRLIYDEDKPVTLTRTVDLFSAIQENYMQAGSVEEIVDHRHLLNSSADSHFANRIDNLPGQYLGSALNTYRRSIDTDQFGTDKEDILSRTQQLLNSELMNSQENPLLIALAQVQGQPTTTVFTIDDLLDVDPDCGRSGIISGTSLSPRAHSSLAHTGSDVSDWTSSDLEGQWAVQLSNAISALMMKHYHTGLNARISNMNYDGAPKTEVRDALPVAEGLPREVFENMIRAIEDFLDDLSLEGRMHFSVDVIANLYDQTEVRVSINGDREQRFFVPSFADSVMTPFYSRDQGLLTRLSTDVERLLGDVSSEISGSSFNIIGGV